MTVIEYIFMKQELLC